MSSDNLDYQRQKGVKSAWKNERENVLKGQGTRDWDLFEMVELTACNSVSGYEGHHMLSVKDHPEEASDPDNIQFLKREEHLEAHNNDFHNQTGGYYDFENKKMIEFEDGEICQQKSYNFRDDTTVEETNHFALQDDILNYFEDHPEDRTDDFASDYNAYDDTSEISEGDDFAPDYDSYTANNELCSEEDYTMNR